MIVAVLVLGGGRSFTGVELEQRLDVVSDRTLCYFPAYCCLLWFASAWKVDGVDEQIVRPGCQQVTRNHQRSNRDSRTLVPCCFPAFFLIFFFFFFPIRDPCFFLVV